MFSRRQLLRAGSALSLGLLVRPGWAAPTLERRIDPRFEWWAALCRAARLPEYRQGAISAWNQALDARLDRVRHHRVVRRLRLLHATHGCGYDAIPSLAAHLSGPPEAMVGRLPWPPFPSALDERWRGVDLQSLVEAGSDAARRADFSGLLQQQAPLLAGLSAGLDEVIAEVDLDWFPAFFGSDAPGRFVVLGGLSVGPNNYGATVDLPEGPEVWAVLSPSLRAGQPVFEQASELLVHELGHHWANAVIDEHRSALEAAGRRLYAQVSGPMRAQAYGDWQVVLQESLLRASVLRYLAAHDGEEGMTNGIGNDVAQGFSWTARLARRLDAYEQDRVRYPTLGAFVPQLVAFFDQTAADLETLPARRPKVLSISPPNGSRKVDPATDTLVVTFDRPMRDRSWSVCGGGPKLPPIDDPSYDPTRTVFTAKMRLEPGRDYEFWLNVGRFQAFRAEDGTALESVHVRFRTRSG